MKKSEETRRRLLQAATEEFSAFGIAGARVDRIAAAADCNKQAIYAYFGSKDGLYAAVYTAMVVGTIESVPIDGFDLPGYAVRLFDWYAARPEVLRLAFWSQLETPAGTAPPAVVQEANLRKVEAIQAAQAAGAVTDSLPAPHLLDLLLRMSMMGTQGEAGAPDALRRSLHEAATRLVAPRRETPGDQPGMNLS